MSEVQGARRPARHSRQLSSFTRLAGQKHVRQRAQVQTHGEDDATLRYIQRVLCAQKSALDSRFGAPSVESLQEELPALTSSREVDVQLYALIAVILCQFVQSWYNKITPDQEFVGEIVRIIAHCAREVERRFRLLDIESILLDDIPSLIIDHLDAFDTASRAARRSGMAEDVRPIFHMLRQHPALAPVPTSSDTHAEQLENESAWCQSLVVRILSLLLPPDDLLNPGLQVLTSELFSELIVHNALCSKASEPWVIWDGVAKSIQSSQTALAPLTTRADSARSSTRLEEHGLLTRTLTSDTQRSIQHRRLSLHALAQLFWDLVSGASLAWSLLYNIIAAIMQVDGSHADSAPKEAAKGLTHIAASTDPNRYSAARFGKGGKRPLLAMSVWPCLSRLTRLNQRMPWLTGFASLVQRVSLHGPGQVCGADSRLDRLMSQYVREQLRDPNILPGALRSARHAMFPANALAPARPVPSPEDVIKIKHECAKAILGLIPPHARSLLFATSDEEVIRRDIESTLDIFADPYINKALIVATIELLVLRLFPELH